MTWTCLTANPREFAKKKNGKWENRHFSGQHFLDLKNLGERFEGDLSLTHRIHVWYEWTYIYHTNQPNVGTYTIHGSYGLLRPPFDLGAQPSGKNRSRVKLAQEICHSKKLPPEENQAPKLDSESIGPSYHSLPWFVSLPLQRYLPVQVRTMMMMMMLLLLLLMKKSNHHHSDWKEDNYTVSGMNYRSQLVCRISRTHQQ